jgi:4,5-DOPA dioxygenase extradiol
MNKTKMPVLFVGHGSPMNAIESNFYTNEWKKMANGIPTPTAILCVSAHWLTKGTYVTAANKPATIHDMYGFPNALYEVQYPAPGAPIEANEIHEKTDHLVQLDNEWGFDHGTWSVLVHMFPEADIPVFQLSIDYHQPAAYHFNLANQLQYLRNKGVLIIGSGNIVHNLRMMNMTNESFDWAKEFDEKIAGYIDQRNFSEVIDYEKMGSIAQLAVPTPDHYYPLIYSLGLVDSKDDVEYFAAKNTMGSISMRSIKFH